MNGSKNSYVAIPKTAREIILGSFAIY
jgi:hypothetical protein